jgi:hypothetical protein
MMKKGLFMRLLIAALALALALTLSLTQAFAEGSVQRLRGGETTAIPGTDYMIEITSVQHRRCFVGEDCSVDLYRVELTVTRGDGSWVIVLYSGVAHAFGKAPFGGREITLKAVEPEPYLERLSRNPFVRDYWVVLGVE